MSKTKKSKFLAYMLCASVVAGLYAGPVMAAEDRIEKEDSSIVINDLFGANGNISFTVDGREVVKVSADDGLVLNGPYEGSITLKDGYIRASKGAEIAGVTLYDNTVTADKGVIGGVTLDNSTIVAANGNFKVANTGAITAQRGSWIGNAYFGNGYVAVNDGKETEASIGGNHRDGGYLKLNTKDDELVELTGDQLRDIKNGTQNIKYDEVNRQTVIEGATSFDASGMGIESMGGQTTLVGGQALFSDKNGEFTQIMGNQITTGNVNLDTINGVAFDDVVLTGKNTAGIERKEVQTIDGTGYATVIEGGTVIGSDGSFSTADGKFTIEKNGRVSVAESIHVAKGGQIGAVEFDEAGMVIESMNGTTAIVGGQATFSNQNGFTNINGGQIITGDITAETLNGADIDELIASVGTIGETNKNVAGIKRDELTETTTIEGATSFDANGMVIESMNGTTAIVGGQATFMGQNGFTQIMGGNIQTDSINGVNFDDLVNRVEDLEDKTQNITGSEPGTGEGGSTVPPTTGGETGIEGDVTVGGDLTAGSGNIGGVTMEDGKVTAGEGNFSDKVTVGGENGTSIDKDGVNVGGENGTSITDKDVVINQGTDNEVRLSDVGNRVDNLEQGMASMSNRISKVEDRIDKVGAMSAAIANLRTMGYDPTAPTEIAVGIGQYRSETGAALGLFHYPNKDFMLSLSVSTSGDEVMGGIGATWKFGRKSPEQMLAAEKEKAAKAKLAKAEAMKKAAAEAKVAEQQAKHAKMAAEKAAK